MTHFFGRGYTCEKRRVKVTGTKVPIPVNVWNLLEPSSSLLWYMLLSTRCASSTTGTRYGTHREMQLIAIACIHSCHEAEAEQEYHKAEIIKVSTFESFTFVAWSAETHQKGSHQQVTENFRRWSARVGTESESLVMW
jgi:hypothetical protein